MGRGSGDSSVPVRVRGKGRQNKTDTKKEEKDSEQMLLTGKVSTRISFLFALPCASVCKVTTQSDSSSQQS